MNVRWRIFPISSTGWWSPKWPPGWSQKMASFIPWIIVSPMNCPMTEHYWLLSQYWAMKIPLMIHRSPSTTTIRSSFFRVNSLRKYGEQECDLRWRRLWDGPAEKKISMSSCRQMGFNTKIFAEHFPGKSSNRGQYNLYLSFDCYILLYTETPTGPPWWAKQRWGEVHWIPW